MYNTINSLQQDITYSVPQGSRDDLPFCVKQILFADDTTTHTTGKQINDLYNDMNNEFEILAD